MSNKIPRLIHLCQIRSLVSYIYVKYAPSFHTFMSNKLPRLIHLCQIRSLVSYIYVK